MLMQAGGILAAGFLLATAYIQWSQDRLSLTPTVRSQSGLLSDTVSDATPTFDIKAPGLEIEVGAKSTNGILKGKKGELVAKVLTTNNQTTGITTSLVNSSNGALKVTIPSSHAFHPGKYRLVVEAKKGDKTISSQQDFTWGVLVANLDKSTYKIGETANLGAALTLLLSAMHGLMLLFPILVVGLLVSLVPMDL